MGLKTSKRYKFLLFGLLVLASVLYYYTVGWVQENDTIFSAITQSISSQEKSFYIGFSDVESARIFEENVESWRFPEIALDEYSTRVFDKVWASLARVVSTKSTKELQQSVVQYEPTYIEEVPVMQVFASNDPLVLQQRHMQDIVDITTCTIGEAKTLAVVDTHFDNNHEDLDLQLYFVSEPGKGSHGTHVASVAAWLTNNSLWIASVSQGMQFIAIDASENDTTIAYGLEWMMLARFLWADVINISWWSYTKTSQAYSDFFDTNPNMIFVAAAGNDSSKSMAFPASHEKVLSVGAIPEQWTFEYIYNSGDICAPWVDLLVADKDSWYTQASGTSLSSAYISGLMAAGLDLSKYIKKSEDKGCVFIDLSVCK